MPRRPHAPLILLLAIFLAAVAPTLRWPQFSGGSENLVVGTVLEMRRPNGPWLIPNLKGQPRVTKPPLTAWITAAAARPQTINDLTTHDPHLRDQAYTDLAWQVRYPALLATLVLLLATYDLARTLSSNSPERQQGGPTSQGHPGASDSFHVDRCAAQGARFTFPVISTAIAATSILTLRFCRAATTDVYLALFATLANAAAARALFLPRRRYPYAALAGLFVGLGAMSKGPPVLAQTAAPVLAFAAWQWWTTRRQRPPSYSSSILHRSSFISLFLLATAVTLLIALPWPAYVLYRRGAGQLDYWSGEVLTGGRNPTFVPDPIYAYASIFPLMLPWLPLFLWGIAAIAYHTFRRRDSQEMPNADLQMPNSAFGIRHSTFPRPFFALCLAFIPILVMSCFTQKNERYLLPMAAPCALVAAYALTLPTPRKYLPWRNLTLAAQWIILFALALAPLATPFLKTTDHQPWSPSPLALLITTLLLALSLTAWRLDRHTPVPEPAPEHSQDPDPSPTQHSAPSTQSSTSSPTSDLRPLTSPPLSSILHPLSSPVVPATFLSTLALQLLFMHGYAQSDGGRSEIKPLADTIALTTPSDLPVYNYYPKNARHKAPIDLLIYLNRLVTPTRTIDPTTPQILVLYHDPNKPLPPALHNWTRLATAERDSGIWEAYLPPPTPAPTTHPDSP